MTALGSLRQRLWPRPQRARLGAIGLDFALHQVNLVQLKRRADGTLAIHAKAGLPYVRDREQTLASAPLMRQQITAALRQYGFSGRRVVAGMPSGHFRTLSLHYRSRPGVPDAQVIAEHMSERLDGKLAEHVLDYLPVRQEARDGEKLAIVAVSPRQQVLAMLEAANGAGLEIDAVEIGPVALRRLVNAAPDADSKMVLVLTTGRTASYLTMLAGRRLLMDKQVEFSEERLLHALAVALDVQEDAARTMVLRTGLHVDCGRTPRDHRVGETGIFNTLLEILKPEFLGLIEQIDRAFMYAAAQMRGGGEGRICLLGSLARWDGMDRVLSDLAHLPVTTVANPLLGATGDATDSTPPELAVAAGLAMRGMCDDE